MLRFFTFEPAHSYPQHFVTNEFNAVFLTFEPALSAAPYPNLTRTLPATYPHLTRTLPATYPHRTHTVPAPYTHITSAHSYPQHFVAIELNAPFFTFEPAALCCN